MIHRSSVYQTHRACGRTQLAQHPLNNGIFVLGHARQHDHLHVGDFREVQFLHDKYYNVHLQSLQVDGGRPLAAPKLAPEHVTSSVSNAIVDSGASMIMLPRQLLDGFDGEAVTLTMTPETYWQTHAPQPNHVSFQFVCLPNWPNQTVLGLPLLNNYYTIFDRAERETGAVLFAGKRFEPHRLSDDVHRAPSKLRQLFRENQVDVE